MEFISLYKKFQKKKLLYVLSAITVFFMICLLDSNYEEKETFNEEEVSLKYLKMFFWLDSKVF